MPLPESPVLLLPANNDTNVNIRPTFKWNPANFADLYWIQVSSDELFSNIFYELKGTSSTTLRVFKTFERKNEILLAY